jgi:hypothetical protein
MFSVDPGSEKTWYRGMDGECTVLCPDELTEKSHQENEKNGSDFGSQTLQTGINMPVIMNFVA